jgi:hypothetical protein
MPFAPFFEQFPEIAERETRTLTVIDLPDLPPGEYSVVEAYCNEEDCDCRRVFFNVVEAKTGDLKAVIAYGWETKEFYTRWLGYDDPIAIKELQGPTLNTVSHQSKLAPALLKQLKYILKDDRYVERLKQHYQMYKAALNPQVGKQVGSLEKMMASKRARRRRKK